MHNVDHVCVYTYICRLFEHSNIHMYLSAHENVSRALLGVCRDFRVYVGFF